ncbi:MAG: GntG family PLP-dependent aldolase [bacterium JZ-2024 1]
MKVVDLRSDTVTKPTPEMRSAMATAEVGDDVLGDDPTVQKLEALAAEHMGKEAALFVPSGIMGNSIAIKLWTQEGDEVIVDRLSHCYHSEIGSMAVISRVLPRVVEFANGLPDPDEIMANIRKGGPHTPKTSLLCLENTHNLRGGRVVPLPVFERLREIADWFEIRIHLDGARIFNAAVASGVSARAFAQHADSIMFCLSKGLCAPVGSILAGSAPFIARARKLRRLLGGGMRQAGILAAAGIVALTRMTDRLIEDHAKAKALANGLADTPGLLVFPEETETNIVVLTVDIPNLDATAFATEATRRGVLCLPVNDRQVRLVTHHDVSADDIPYAVEILKATTADLITQSSSGCG